MPEIAKFFVFGGLVGYNRIMGNTADSRKTEKTLAALLAKAGRAAPSQSMVDEAADLAHRDGMRLDEALRIVSGATRLPYGTPRKP